MNTVVLPRMGDAGYTGELLRVLARKRAFPVPRKPRELRSCDDGNATGNKKTLSTQPPKPHKTSDSRKQQKATPKEPEKNLTA